MWAYLVDQRCSRAMYEKRTEVFRDMLAVCIRATINSSGDKKYAIIASVACFRGGCTGGLSPPAGAHGKKRVTCFRGRT